MAIHETNRRSVMDCFHFVLYIFIYPFVFFPLAVTHLFRAASGMGGKAGQ